LAVEDLPVSVLAARQFPIRVSLSFVACMKKNHPNYPLLRQVLPIKDELLLHPDFNHEATGELKSLTDINSIHKYH
jgi:L-lysine 2,3-aminomutase